MFGIKCTLVDSIWGCIEVPGESVTVCSWNCHFPLHAEGWSEHLLRATTSTQVTRCMWRRSCQKWTWCHQSTIWWCTNDMELSDDDIYVIFVSGLGGIKGWMHGGRGSQFQDFRCRAQRAELIPSRVFQCVPTLGQPGMLYLTTTKMCLVHWLISISILLWSEPCFYWIWLLEWPPSQWAQLKELECLVTRTAILYQSWQRLRKRDQGVPGPPLPFRVNMWHTHTHTYIYIYRERERERERDR